MKIAESNIQLASSHTAVEYSERRESLTVWRQGRESVRAEQKNSQDDGLQKQAEQLAKEAAKEAAKVSLSAEAQQKAAGVAETAASADASALGEDGDLLTDLNMRILKALFEKLTGRKFTAFKFDAAQQSAAAAQSAATVDAAQATPTNAGWGLRYERRETYHESENTQFAAQGVVKTADGMEIEIGVELNMSRSFSSTLDESLLMGDARLKDPLVINFDGSAAQLTRDTFSFDVDADGSADQMNFVGPGSGFFALDANSDGAINDGNELFGAQSGDGFADLAAYDGDGNGWIDENDDIYSQLRIWTKTADGEDQLLALGAKGVGAIYLGRVETPFSIKDSSNELQGQVRATGIFLFEQGGVGTMQQLDLVA